MLLVIDNYDSFVHNLARYFQRLGAETIVVRNDQVTVADIRAMKPDAILLSPGPCTPNEAGCCLDLVLQLLGTVPMLGICLGHQVIGQALGGRVVRANQPVHGRSSLVHHSQRGLFAGLPSPLRVGRYHSLVVDRATLPTQLVETATTDDGQVMAFEHRSESLYGLQFHPESVLTEGGMHLLAAFLDRAGMTHRPLEELITNDDPCWPSGDQEPFAERPSTGSSSDWALHYPVRDWRQVAPSDSKKAPE